MKMFKIKRILLEVLFHIVVLSNLGCSYLYGESKISIQLLIISMGLTIMLHYLILINDRDKLIYGLEEMIKSEDDNEEENKLKRRQ